MKILSVMITCTAMLLCGTTIQAFPSEHVIILHGLARTEHSMSKLEESLRSEGYVVLNKGYASRSQKIEELSEKVISEAIEECRKNRAEKIHFVTHSMGGILLRYYLSHQRIPEMGKVVMLSPPNKGSEAVDKLGHNFIYELINGPAGGQLGTDSDSITTKLAGIDFDLGIITGDRSFNPFLSLIIPGADDGKVSVESARVEGMKDFIIVHSSHTFIMRNQEVIDQTIWFLRYGSFRRDDALQQLK